MANGPVSSLVGFDLRLKIRNRTGQNIGNLGIRILKLKIKKIQRFLQTINNFGKFLQFKSFYNAFYTPASINLKIK